MARFRRGFIFIFVAVGLVPVLVLAPTGALAAPPQGADWRARLNQQLQLMGHRNWIAVVDSAYPLQTSAGIETVETNDDQLEVVKTVLGQIAKSEHVRSVVFTDAELKVVPESDAKGVTAYRDALATILGKSEAQSLPHEEIISKLDEAGKTFHILVLKTRMTIPYTSVFIRLECGYWSADAEKRLREAMAGR
jgi:D-ribose pyranose/furanose isomerase RbsD